LLLSWFSSFLGVVHAKGAGAFGYFEVTNDDLITKICKADMFKGVGKRTPVSGELAISNITSVDSSGR
jgi:hypothetical protein